MSILLVILFKTTLCQIMCDRICLLSNVQTTYSKYYNHQKNNILYTHDKNTCEIDK